MTMLARASKNLPDYVVPNVWIIIMNREGCGRNWLWPNLRYYPGILLEGLRKTMKDLREDSGHPSRGSKWAPPIHK
jgi:hypothetical protein